MTDQPEVIVIWEFEVRTDSEDEFRQIYGNEGDWAQLFRRAEGFRGTELLRDLAAPRRYFTLDRWSSLAAFEAFGSGHNAEYRELDERCAGLTVTERRLGSFAIVP
ncbi:MAG: antibiotic biosynthesis monooxygenase [Acidobacteriales bacterium]|nr:antibiotic biosynthesis monooxygenase [Terriglobales bacterium]